MEIKSESIKARLRNMGVGFPEEQDDIKRLINVADLDRTLREAMGIDRNVFADIARDLISAIPELLKIVKDAQGITLGAPTESPIPAPIDELKKCIIISIK